jgi:hypothetical protein
VHRLVQGDECTLSVESAAAAHLYVDMLCGLPPLWVRDPAWRGGVRTLLSKLQKLNNSQ